MKQLILLTLVVSIFLTACGGEAVPGPTERYTPLPSPTQTAPPTGTMTATQTATITPTPTTTRVHQGPDAIVVPILLYHRIAVSPVDSQYYVSPDKFEDQMKLLHDWEYTVIPIELLVKAIKEGADLPPRPVIITFDDGNISVYETAFPIMSKYGLTGAAYIVGNYMDTDGYMSADQIKELAGAGWEIGSHSRSHRDLRKLDPAIQRLEIVKAREKLHKLTGTSVDTFAYPFGFMGETAGRFVHNAGYIAGMGLGYTNDQGLSNLFWLQRRDVKGGYDIKRFTDFLPWHGDPAYLPTDTPSPTPTASRTPTPTASHTPTPTATHTPIPAYTQYPTKTPQP